MRLGPHITYVALVALGGCSEPLPAPNIGPPPPMEGAKTSEELLSLQHLPRFDLTLSVGALAALEAEPREWVSGSFEYDGVRYDDVGIRLKGNHSFQPIGEKPSFKVKFNKFTRRRRFLGLEALTLNSMVVDSSKLREWTSYRILAELGAPAPQVGFAEIWLNGEPYGLYLNLAPYDDVFLEREFADASGNLYESEGADLDGKLDKWEQDEGEDESLADLEAFSELAQQEGGGVFYGATGVVDMPNFLNFLAAETYVSQFDGHISGHNFFIYHEPSADLWSYMPWSLDQAMSRHVSAFDHEGYLGAKCMRDPQCLVDYIVTSQDALRRVAEADFVGQIGQAIALTDEAMMADPRMPHTVDDVLAGRERIVKYLSERGEELQPQLDCLVGGTEPDDDGDGYGPCFQDCDDANPNINPDAAEACDGVDNDCTGYADDTPTCECPSVVSEGRTFYLCVNSLEWLDARDYCVEQGRTLARFDSAAQTEEVWAAAEELSGGRWSIGLNDRDTENEYVWPDGSAPDFDVWADGQPAHRLEWFDCVFLSGAKWAELNCIESANFICTD